MNVVTLHGLSSTGCAQRYGRKRVSTHRRVLRATDPESERNGSARGLSPARIDSCSVVAGGVSTTLGCRQTGGRDDVWFTRTLAARGVGDHSVHVSTGIGDGRHRYNGTSVCTVCGGACSAASDIALRCSRTPGRFPVRIPGTPVGGLAYASLVRAKGLRVQGRRAGAGLGNGPRGLQASQ